MFKLSLGFTDNSDKEDVLSAYRERLIYRFAIVFIAIFLPLMIFNFVRGQNALAMAIGCVLVIVLLNAAAIYLKKDVPIARTALIVGLVKKKIIKKNKLSRIAKSIALAHIACLQTFLKPAHSLLRRAVRK